MNNTRMYQIISKTQESLIRARVRFDRQRVQSMQQEEMQVPAGALVPGDPEDPQHRGQTPYVCGTFS